MSSSTRLCLVGARWGQGTSTVALALAAQAAAAGRTVALVVDDLDDACAITGIPPRQHSVLLAPGLTLVPRGLEPSVDLVVEDTAGPAVGDEWQRCTALLVVRGPDYLSLRSALAHPIGACGAIVIREPWRSLTAGDVASTLGVPVLAEVEHSAEVARATDAGLLLTRIATMAPFRQLRRLALDGVHPAVLDATVA